MKRVDAVDIALMEVVNDTVGEFEPVLTKEMISVDSNNLFAIVMNMIVVVVVVVVILGDYEIDAEVL
jgi:hypothetical protein